VESADVVPPRARDAVSENISEVQKMAVAVERGPHAPAKPAPRSEAVVEAREVEKTPAEALRRK
jgi:hypothetical protein